MPLSAQTPRLIFAIFGGLILLSLVFGAEISSETQSRVSSIAGASDVAAAGIKTDRNVYRKLPLPRLPRAGGTLIDPVFGTEIMRATDESDGAAPGLGTYYSHWPTFNVDNTRLLIRQGESGRAILKSFDPIDFKIGSGREPLPIEYPHNFALSWESAIWSHTDPSLIYTFCNDFKGGMRVYVYNVVRKDFKLLKDFSSLGQGGPDYLHQMNMSADDDVFSWSHMRTGRNGVPVA